MKNTNGKPKKARYGSEPPESGKGTGPAARRDSVSSGADGRVIPQQSGISAASRYTVFHVPHDGHCFPPELMGSVCIPEETFIRYHSRMSDRYVGRLIPRLQRENGGICSFGVSRLLCDVERFIGPEEIMERYGMGFCYEKVYDGTVIKQVTDETREKTRRYYDEHHRLMNELCERHPRILLIDLHSYWDDIIPGGPPQPAGSTPDLCIGTDARYTPESLLRTVRDRFSEAGLATRIDFPYSGFYVPESLTDGSSRCDLIGLMLEFHRRSYLDSEGKPVQEKIGAIRKVIREILAACGDM